VCPLCKKGKTLLDIDWEGIEDVVSKIKGKKW
jgi:hypothetical protein